MGILGRLGCGCRHRPFGGLATGPCDVSGACTTDSAPGTDCRASAAQQYLKDPLMGAKSEADVDLAAELKEHGNEKYKKDLFQDALSLYNEAVHLQPRNPSLWLNRSMANRQMQNWQDAAEDAELAAELQPDNAKAHYSLALCLQQLGRLEESLKSCRAGLKVQQDNKALQQLFNVVKRTLAEPDRGPSRDDGRVDESSSAAPAGGDSGDAAKRSEKIQKGEVRRRKRVLTQEEKDRRRETAKSANVDASACPASALNENDMHDIKQRVNKFEWKFKQPSQAERDGMKKAITDMFKSKYVEINEQKELHAADKKKSGLQTDQYDKSQKQGLQLKGAHQPMDRPEHVDLPKGYKDPVGVLTLDELKSYSFENQDRRIFISVYGNIFDVSDRPDKYGPDGPYTVLTGADITWGLAAGVDSEEYVNRCFDLFKAKDMGKDKIAGVCSWLAWYWVEYGDPVGQLDLYMREHELPAPPLEEIDDACCVM